MPVQNIILGADKRVRNAIVERYVSVTQHTSMLSSDKHRRNSSCLLQRLRALITAQTPEQSLPMPTEVSWLAMPPGSSSRYELRRAPGDIDTSVDCDVVPTVELSRDGRLVAAADQLLSSSERHRSINVQLKRAQRSQGDFIADTDRRLQTRHESNRSSSISCTAVF